MLTLLKYHWRFLNQLVVFVSLFLILSGTLISAADAKPKRIGTYQHWRVFTDGSGADQQCFAVSEPRKKLPAGAKRGEIFLSITHRPAQNVRYEPSIRVGYPMSDSVDPLAEIDGQPFRFFSGAQAKIEATEWAWLEEPTRTEALIAEMKKGNQFEFTAMSARGTQTRDSYSLLGFTRALKALDEACAP